MPGSKRNKLKKMLSPNSTPAQDSISVTSPLSPPPLDGAIPPPVVPADGIAADGDNYMTDDKLQEELAVVEEMQRREQTVGSGMDLGQRDAAANPGPSKKKSSRQRFEEREVSV